MRVIFMGTPDFSVSALDALIAAGHEIIAVYSQPPRPAGRGKKLRPGPVHQRAVDLGLEVRTPLNFKDDAELQAFSALNADIAVVVAYGLILPQVILDAPRLGCLNIHASLLPRWRGAAPIHRAIMAGDAKTGICIMQMDAGLDTGPVLLRDSMEISDQATTGMLHDQLAEMGGRLVVETLQNLSQLKPEPQTETGMTYARKIDKSEARVDWQQNAVQISRQIRGLSPFPGAWCEIFGERIKLLNCEIVDGSGTAGLVLDAEITVACGQGALRLTRLQRAGKAAMDGPDFLRGFAINKGDILA